MNRPIPFTSALLLLASFGVNLTFAESPDPNRPADKPTPGTDRNSQIAHEQLVKKAKKGGIDVYLSWAPRRKPITHRPRPAIQAPTGRTNNSQCNA